MFKKIKELFNDIKEIKDILIQNEKLIIDDINMNRVKTSFYDQIDDEFDGASSYMNREVKVFKGNKIIREGDCINAGVIITNDKTFKYRVTCFLTIKTRSGREFTEIITEDKYVEIGEDYMLEPTNPRPYFKPVPPFGHFKHGDTIHT